jgi:SAM-dependent methyltransferase
MALRERTDPVPFHEALAAEAVSGLNASLSGATVVDLGCGPGHYTRALRSAGAIVIPIDLDVEEFSLPGGPPGAQLVADGIHLPIATASCDGVFCSNMLEHTPGPHSVLDEIERVVRPGGWIWLSWTNWYSPWGGHEISPFHYLGPRLGVTLHRRLGRPAIKNLPGQGLFPTHIGAMLREVRRRPQLQMLRAVPRYYPSQAWIVRVPGLREVATWNCLLELRRVNRPR